MNRHAAHPIDNDPLTGDDCHTWEDLIRVVHPPEGRHVARADEEGQP